MSTRFFSERAGGGRRAAALALDLLCLAVLSVIVGVVASSLFSISEQEFVEQKGFGSSLAVDASNLVTALSGVWIVLVFYLLMETFSAVTPGKRLLSLRLGASDGTPARFGRRLLRALYKYGLFVLISVFGQYILLLGAVSPTFSSIWNGIAIVWFLTLLLGWFLVFGKRRQALHDRLSGTAVFVGSARAEHTLTDDKLADRRQPFAGL